MIQIGFDARMVLHSGIGTYTRGILKILTREADLDFTLFGDLPLIANYNAKKVLAEFPIYSVREQIFFPKILSRHSVQFLHVPHYNAPLGFGGDLVVTLHDLIHLKFPPSRLAYLYARGMMEAVSRRAKRVIVDSENTKRDLMQRIGTPESKIRIVYPGIDPEFSPQPQNLNIPEDPWTRDPFLLYVGNIRATKNIRNLVEGFTLARKKIRDLKLLMVGKNFMPEYTREIPHDSGIRLAGEVNLPTLITYYQKSKIFVFPSLYEGFGLPPLEAMACGAPVICSNAASLPEVAGNAAVLFDPRSPGELAEAIVSLWNDGAKIQELRKKGFEQAGKFTWGKCAEQIHEVYRECTEPS